jgi:glutamine amidotransferase
MTQKIVVIDYGAGNIHSAAKAFEHLGADVTVSADPHALFAADRIVLPGQGAFGDCIGALTAIPGMRAGLEEAVIKRQRPFLGICVGMQLLATEGHENGTHKGLGWIAGTVDRMTAPVEQKIPHMGWNELIVTQPHPLTTGLKAGDHAYFVHSYALRCATDHILATTSYGEAITAIVARGNIAGMQFHPEKSQSVGLKLLDAFLKWAP